VGFSEAARLVNYNITQSRMIGIDAGAAKDKQPPQKEQSGTAKSTQVQ
jgi:hypothetical protein